MRLRAFAKLTWDRGRRITTSMVSTLHCGLERWHPEGEFGSVSRSLQSIISMIVPSWWKAVVQRAYNVKSVDSLVKRCLLQSISSSL